MKLLQNIFFQYYMNNKIILESLSMDLLRVAKGLQRGSFRMAERFTDEALQRKSEVALDELKPYFRKVLIDMETALRNSDKKKMAEDALMYSTRVRNYAMKFCV